MSWSGVEMDMYTFYAIRYSSYNIVVTIVN